MTAPAPMLPLQESIHGRLTGDTAGDGALMSLISGVYDYLPEDIPYPYVVLGEATEIPDNSQDRHGRQTVETLHAWDQYRGFRRVLQIGARITELLDHQPLTIVGLHHVSTRFEFSQTLTDPEPPGNIRHLVLRYRITTEQLPA